MNTKHLAAAFAASLVAVVALAQDTGQSKTSCETLLADNTSGDISPQDLRNCGLASRAYAHIYVTGGNTPQTFTTAAKLTGFTADGVEQGADAQAASDQITLPAYAATWEIDFACYASGSINDTIEANIRADAVEVAGCTTGRKFGGSGDAGFTAIHCLATLAASDVITVYVEDADDGSTDFTSIDCSLTVARVDL